MRYSVIAGLLVLAQQLVPALAETVTEYRDAVVFIETEIMDQDGTNKSTETGTGFIVSPDGYIITAAHVVPEPGPNQQAKYTGRIRSRHSSDKVELSVIAFDTRLDTALLMFSGQKSGLKTVRLGDANIRVLLDKDLLALGFPGQSDLSSMKGGLSGQGEKGLWETTLPLNHGISGGPVFSTDMFVVAMAKGGIEGAQQRTIVVPVNLLTPLLMVVPGLAKQFGRPEMEVKSEAVAPSISPQPVAPQRTYWDHNGSVMYLVADGRERTFHYYQPRAVMVEFGAQPNAVIFRGQSDGSSYAGTAFFFSKRCKAKFGYRVSGPIEDDSRRVVMKGMKPVLGPDCKAVGRVPDELVFQYQGNG
jgi:S1-C subfamily serine protease